MYPQLSAMWGRSNIMEVREKHVVTFFTYMLKRQSVHLLLFFLHTMVLRCWSLCLLSECFFLSRLVFFLFVFLCNESGWIFSSSSDKKSNNDDDVWSLRAFFVCFCLSFSHQFEWSCIAGSEDAQKGKTTRQTPGEELWYDCITDWRNAKPWWAPAVASNCSPLRRLSCFHVKQVRRLKRHIPDSKEPQGNHSELWCIEFWTD